MIINDRQLEIVREQLSTAESALDAIRREVRPKNERMYQLMAESYVDTVMALRSEIDAYLGISPLPEAAELVISLEGSRVALGQTSAGAVTRFIDTFRRGLQAITEVMASVDRPESARRHLRWIETACDLPIVGLAPGSVRILLGDPAGMSLFSEEEKVIFSSAMNVLFVALEWADVEKGESVQNAFMHLAIEQRQALLAVVTRLLPPRSGTIERVAFQRRAQTERGPLIRQARLSRQSRERVKRELASIAGNTKYVEIEGVVRSVDLDAQSFVLRDRPPPEPDIPCEYSSELEEAVKEFLDNRVLVSGIMEKSRKTKKMRMSAENIEAISSDDVRTIERT